MQTSKRILNRTSLALALACSLALLAGAGRAAAGAGSEPATVPTAGAAIAPTPAAQRVAAASRRRAAPEAQARRNREEAETFLAGNKVRDGVVALESGLQYEILEPGYGPRPHPSDTVVLHFRGTLLDGTEFGSSWKSGQPGTFSLKRVIPGWREAVPLMPVGSRWRLFLPSRLAYGRRGLGNRVGPDAVTVFEVALIAIASSGGVGTASRPPGQPPELARIRVFFKLDPHLTQSMYLGDRWVSPPTFTSVRQAGEEYLLEARAEGIDAEGGAAAVSPEWVPSDPTMVTVAPRQGEAVRIVVKRAGESRLKVATATRSTELFLKAVAGGGGIQVEVSQ